ncbi:MAG: hypothetical protein VB023_03585 [Oscillibacter sp.]|nr:hypothetical protein [Oscillibacter sp.]
MNCFTQRAGRKSNKKEKPGDARLFLFKERIWEGVESNIQGKATLMLCLLSQKPSVPLGFLYHNTEDKPCKIDFYCLKYK